MVIFKQVILKASIFRPESKKRLAGVGVRYCKLAKPFTPNTTWQSPQWRKILLINLTLFRVGLGAFLAPF